MAGAPAPSVVAAAAGTSAAVAGLHPMSAGWIAARLPRQVALRVALGRRAMRSGRVARSGSVARSGRVVRSRRGAGIGPVGTELRGTRDVRKPVPATGSGGRPAAADPLRGLRGG